MRLVNLVNPASFVAAVSWDESGSSKICAKIAPSALVRAWARAMQATVACVASGSAPAGRGTSMADRPSDRIETVLAHHWLPAHASTTVTDGAGASGPARVSSERTSVAGSLWNRGTTPSPRCNAATNSSSPGPISRSLNRLSTCGGPHLHRNNAPDGGFGIGACAVRQFASINIWAVGFPGSHRSEYRFDRRRRASAWCAFRGNFHIESLRFDRIRLRAYTAGLSLTRTICRIRTWAGWRPRTTTRVRRSRFTGRFGAGRGEPP